MMEVVSSSDLCILKKLSCFFQWKYWGLPILVTSELALQAEVEYSAINSPTQHTIWIFPWWEKDRLQWAPSLLTGLTSMVSLGKRLPAMSSCIVHGLHFHGFVGKCQQGERRRVQQVVVDKIRLIIKDLKKCTKPWAKGGFKHQSSKLKGIQCTYQFFQICRKHKNYH